MILRQQPESGPDGVGLSQFFKESKSASTLGEYWYCAAKVLHKYSVGETKTSSMLYGLTKHEETARETLEKIGRLTKTTLPDNLSDALASMRQQVLQALRRKRILANSQEHITILTILPEPKCHGLPDAVDCKSHKWPIVVEQKFVKYLPETPWLSDSVQAGVYIMGLRALGFGQASGILRYRTDHEERSFEIRLEEGLESKIRWAARQVPAILSHEVNPKPTSNSNKCRICEYRAICKWRADRKDYHPPYFVDIETDMVGKFIWAITAYSSKDSRLRQFFADEPAQEKNILSDFIDLVNEDEGAAILTFSGSDYDRRIIADRLENYDLLSLDRMRFRDMCSSLRHAGLNGTLAAIATPHYRFRHPELKGGMAWSEYSNFLKIKELDSKQQRKVRLLEYNADDVRALLSICIDRPELFENSRLPTTAKSEEGSNIKYLSEMYRKLGSTIERNRPNRCHETEVRFRSSDLKELQKIKEALNSCGFTAKVGPDKKRYAIRLYGSWAREFLSKIGLLQAS